MSHRSLIFHGLETTVWFLLATAAVVAAGVLIVLLLRYERALVPRKVGYVLLLLRLSVLGVLLLTLLEPVLSWTIDRETTGRIVVAVDLSESMNTADPHAGRAEKLRWARSLGMIGNPDINARLDRWIADLEAGREPNWVDDDETQNPQRRTQLAEGRRENLEGVFAEIDGIPRKEIARKILSETASPLLPALEPLGRIELLVFAGKTASADEPALADTFNNPPVSLQLQTTDLTEALSPALASSDSSPVMGVVLLTDGRDTTQRNPAAAAARLGDRDVPVFPVLLGSTIRPKDLAIGALDYPPTVFQNDSPLLKATIVTSGFDGEELEVVLERPSAEPIVKTIIADGSHATVEFQLDAAELGRHEYTLRTDVQPGETRDDNNSRTFALNVVDDTARVLLVDGEARWEFRFLDNALLRDSRVDVKQVLFNQPYLGVLPDTFFPRRLDLPAAPGDRQESPFEELDLVILGDVSPRDMPPPVWELLEKFVAEAGGTLVLTAGKRHFPLAYNSPLVERLLPMTNLRPVNVADADAAAAPTQRGFRLHLTPDGQGESFLQFDADPARNEQIWTSLPGHFWGLLGEAKPGATVHAYAVLPDEDDLLAAERRGGVIVHQHYGFGQVLWIGLDSTWRWRHRVGDEYHHRFWGQLARWAANNKSAVGNEFVKFGPERSDVEVGDDPLIRARWSQPFLQKFPNLESRVDIYRLEDGTTSDKPFTTLKLVPLADRPTVHEARAASLPAGEYRLQLAADGANLGNDEISTLLYVHEPQTAELNDLSANRELLIQLAESTGGRLFLPDQLAALPELLRPPQDTGETYEEIPLWNHWLVLTAFFVLLTTEWVVRKLNGLP